MDIWNVKVLYLGKITMPFSTNMAVLYAFGAPKIGADFEFSAPYLGFLLQNGKHNILIDNGISAKFIVNGRAWAGLRAEGGELFIKKALEACGLRYQEIDTVIYTHLHNDHAGNCSLFANARHVFQKDEWYNLLDPLPIQKVRKDYDTDLIKELESLDRREIDGDTELLSGIKIIKTPGHTLGSQSIGVDTPKGTIVFAGDTLVSYISAFPDGTSMTDIEGKQHGIPPAPEVFGDAIPSNVTYNFYEFYKSVSKIRKLASRNERGFIIPGHEPSLVFTGLNTQNSDVSQGTVR
jgi:N-acyl homoserine lactone hydrolase